MSWLGFWKRGRGKFGRGQDDTEIGQAQPEDIFIFNRVERTDEIENTGAKGTGKYIEFADIARNNQVLYADGVAHIQDYDFEAKVHGYIIDGVTYENPITPFTLSAAHATESRIDVIAGTFGPDGIGKIIIIPGAGIVGTPVKPELTNYDTQIELTFITVGAATTEPAQVTDLLAYDENVEFTTADNTGGARVDFDDTASPYVNSKAIACASFAHGDQMTLTKGSVFNIQDYKNLQLQIERITTKWVKNATLEVAYYDTGTSLVVSSWVKIGSSNNSKLNYKFDSSIDGYQNVLIPTTAFVFTSATADRIIIRKNDNKGAVSFRLDLIRLQVGISEPPIVGGGDMLKSVYDPTGVEDDAFDTDNMAEASTGKTTPTGADTISIWDSVGGIFKKLTFTNLITYLDGFYGSGTGDMLAATYDPTTVTGDAFDTDNMAEASAGKTTPVDADTVSLWDSVGAVFKKLTWANLKATLKTYFDTLYSTLFGTIIIYNVKDYGALGDGIDLLDGAITISTPNFTSITSAFTAGDVGKVIAVEGAGASGGYLVTTISAFVGAGAVTLTDNAVATVSGSNFYYGTDDTSAIQTTIQAAFDAGGGKVYLPRGIYIIDGPLLNNIGPDLIDYNSQLYIPGVELEDANRTSITIQGEFIPNMLQSGGIPAYPAITVATGSCLRSTIQGSGTYPSVIAGAGAAAWTLSRSFTTSKCKWLNVQVTVDGNDKVTMGGIDFLLSSSARIEECVAFPYAVAFTVNSGKPDVLDVIGITAGGHNGEHVQTITGCYVGGFTYGYVSSDHGNCHESSAICCTTSWAAKDAGQTCGVTKLVSHWSIYDIGVIRTVTESRIFIQHVQVEISDAVGKWYDHVATINDPSSYLVGRIDFLAQFPYDGADYDKIGGQHLAVTLMLNSDGVNLQTGTTYTPIILDAFRITKLTNASAITVTIPPYTDLNYDFDTRIDFYQGGAGQVTFVGGTGVTINTAETLKLRNQYSACSLIKEANNIWLITGDIELVP